MTGGSRSKNVLVLSYYFPPLGLSGVQRVTKFVKYLPAYGWQPHVITAKPFSYFAFDESLSEDIPQSVEVTRTTSLDPTRWRLRPGTVGIPSSQHHSKLRGISNRLFVPDNKMLWLPFARRAANNVLHSSDFDLIFSTAPPYSSHLLAIELGRKHDIPVVTDFRDNWVGNPRTVFASARQRQKHQRMERETLKQSSRVIAINEYIADDLAHRSGLSRRLFKVVEQGYDPADFAKKTGNSSRGPISFVYSGVFYDAQKPDTFLHGLAQARLSNKNVRNRTSAVFVGLVPDYFSSLVERLDLADIVTHTGYLDHKAALATVMGADIPWLTIGHQAGEDQISTGKLAEYIGTRKHILGLVPKGAARDLLVQYGNATITGPDDVAGTERAIVALTESLVNGQDLGKPDESVVRRLNRKKLTADLAQVFNEVVVD